MKRSDVLRTTVLGLAFVAARSSPARAADDVRLRVPQGVDYSGSTTTAAPDGGLYVTVTGLLFRNASSMPQSYRATDLHLLVGGHAYAPVVRPKLGSIDAIEPGIVGPRETLHLSATFHVPAGSSRGDIEFTPRWTDDTGRSVDFCCYYI